jgi:hypothetical protein
MLVETAAAHVHGFLVVAGAAILFRELCKGNRRRVLLDPASEFFDPWIIGHDVPLTGQ